MSVVPDSVPTSFLGADVDALAAFGRQLTVGADALGGIRTARTGDLATLAWLGQDRTGFEEQWRSGHAVALQRVEDAIREAAARVEEQARDQQRVSEGGSGGALLAAGAGAALVGATPTPPQDERYGSPSGAIAGKYESGGRADRVSTGVGDPGGVSYGRYQISQGTMPAYVRWAKDNDPAAYAALHGKSSTSRAFKQAWRDLATADPDGFAHRQFQFIEQTHYQPVVRQMEQYAPGFTMRGRSQAVAEAIWSMSVQHGERYSPGVIRSAFAGQDVSTMTDAQVITALYDERGRNDGRAHFPSSPRSWQHNIAVRMQNEKRDALAMLGGQ